MVSRAVKVIPVWLTLRAAYMGFISAMRDSIRFIRELDKALARAGAVTAGVGNVQQFLCS